MFHNSQNARMTATIHVPNHFDGDVSGIAGLPMHVKPAQHLGRQQRLHGLQRTGQSDLGRKRVVRTGSGCSERLRGRCPSYRSNILPAREASSVVAVTPAVVWAALAIRHAICS